MKTSMKASTGKKNDDMYVSVPLGAISEIVHRLEEYADDLNGRASRARATNGDEHRADFLAKEAAEVKHLAAVLVGSRVTAKIRSACEKCCKDDPRAKNW